MNIQTENYYVSQHKDDEAADVYRVIRNVQEWVRAFPKDVIREPILFGLTRDEAEVTARMFNRENGKGSFVDDASKRIEFLQDNDTNRETCERADLPCPLIY